METDDFSNENLEPSASTAAISRINLLTMFRLGLFQMGLGIMSLLTLGVLNRVMIDELKVPALVTAGAIAMHQFVAPARVWFGQMSDSKPFLGHHRTGYVWVGAALFAIASFLAVQVMWQLGSNLQTQGWTAQTYGWVGLLGLVFAIYGLALSSSSTPFAALLVDVSDESNRSKLVGIVWSMLMVGIVIGAIIISVVLKPLALDAPIAAVQASINRVFMIIPAAVFGLALLATVGVEKKYSCYASRSSLSDREDSITFGRALKILTANRQTGLFFTFLLVMTISLFMQEPVLEPYGAQVFQMQISETTRLNAFWGMGTLLGISSTGFLVVPRLGKQKTTRWGCFLVALSFLLIISSGFSQNAKLLQGALFLFGLASGITTTGAISLMLDLTAAETAGTFIGAWGLSQAMARALATVTGGAVLDIGKKLFSNLVFAYGLVFALQAVGMVLAVWFLGRVNVQEFRSNNKQAIAAVLEGDLD
ncbi:BCD family MFS transporter [Trichocoleus sp. FACHB-591]|uniref:BCD family MFS transporter n=1 Tax=Trichocoleus sp. FACHB-591 TaxID=2692872 RepID=UPI001683415B|nr:BCD family MFS transporter [Trichocoleus sp. FACHB-591]